MFVSAEVDGPLGRLPAVPALDVRQQPEHIGTGTRPGFNPAEPFSDPGHGLVKHLPPAGRGYAKARSHRTTFRSPHNPR